MNFLSFYRKNLLSFLYALSINKEVNVQLYDKLFHFNRINNLFLDEKMNKDLISKDYEIIDHEQKDILRTLKFYNFIDENNEITQKGADFLKNSIKKDSWLRESVKLFETHYKGETIFEKSCVNARKIVPVNCYYCKCSSVDVCQ